jgi:transcriptional regulator with GAF, ATPase, and Fis domain
MGAVLVGMDGPPKGRLVPLGEVEVSVGRDQTNAVPIDDLAASRRHCVIRAAGERFQLTDLESRNGTFVNGVPVRQRLLEHNDQIRVGGSLFLFLRAAPTEPATRSIEMDGALVTRSTALLGSGHSIYLNPERLAKSLPTSERTVKGVQVLLRISQALQGARTLEELERQLLELLFEAAPAEQGAILLAPAGGGDFDSTFAWHRAGRATAIQINSALSSQVMSERVTVLGEMDGEGKGVRRWVLAAPLICFERIEGVLYLETRASAPCFDEQHQELVSAVGAIAGVAIRNLLRTESLRTENQRLQSEIRIEHDMVGESDAMRAIHQFIARVAATDSTVLIDGESGTGKELVARALHLNSARAGGPFIAVNCAALTESLLEDELFGHERGAFTGAVGLKKGKFEMAHGGTLFLDEVGEMAPSLQAKLLRVLQQREFERVGGTRPIQVDVRIIAATNRDLEGAVRAGAFRQDLFFRLNVIPVTMPPLRGRREDIPLLAAYFVERSSQRVKRKVVGISHKASALLVRYDWPGNVRELENAMERAVVLGVSDTILPEDLPEPVLESASTSTSAPATANSYHEALLEAKRRVVTDALERAGGVYTEAAKLLDIHPNYLHRLVNSLGLRSSGGAV